MAHRVLDDTTRVAVLAASGPRSSNVAVKKRCPGRVIVSHLDVTFTKHTSLALGKLRRHLTNLLWLAVVAKHPGVTRLPTITTPNEVRKMFHPDVAQNIKEISIPKIRKDSKTSTAFITGTTKEQAIAATNYSPKDIEKMDFVAIFTLCRLE